MDTYTAFIYKIFYGVPASGCMAAHHWESMGIPPQVWMERMDKGVLEPTFHLQTLELGLFVLVDLMAVLAPIEPPRTGSSIIPVDRVRGVLYRLACHYQPVLEGMRPKDVRTCKVTVDNIRHRLTAEDARKLCDSYS